MGLSFGIAFLQPNDVSDYIETGNHSLSSQRKPLVIYPSPQAKGVINVHDVDILRLTPGVYLNDNLIDFGMKYLFEQGRLSPSNKCLKQASNKQASDKEASKEASKESWMDNTSRFHYYSQFFFNRLADGMKSGKFYAKTGVKTGDMITDGQKLEWDQLKRWNRKVDVLSKDFLVIPINKDEHWSVAIICNPGCVKYAPRKGKDEETVQDVATEGVTEGVNEEWGEESLNKRPCIIFLDSAKYHHSQTVFKHIRKFLQFAWNDSQNLETFGPRVFDATTFPAFSPKVPQQENNCDCGVYLLHFVEMILSNPPLVTENFINDKGSTLVCKTGDSQSVKPGTKHKATEWFPLSDITAKRRDIKMLLSQLASKQHELLQANAANKK